MIATAIGSTAPTRSLASATMRTSPGPATGAGNVGAGPWLAQAVSAASPSTAPRTNPTCFTSRMTVTRCAR